MNKLSSKYVYFSFEYFQPGEIPFSTLQYHENEKIITKTFTKNVFTPGSFGAVVERFPLKKSLFVWA